MSICVNYFNSSLLRNTYLFPYQVRFFLEALPCTSILWHVCITTAGNPDAIVSDQSL